MRDSRVVKSIETVAESYILTFSETTIKKREKIKHMREKIIGYLTTKLGGYNGKDSIAISVAVREGRLDTLLL